MSALSSAKDDFVIEARDLRVEIPLGRFGSGGRLRAVDGIDVQVRRAEILALVGESGCGKSTTGRALVRLIRPSAGQVLLNGTDISRLSSRELRPYRCCLQMIFQHPGPALNPRVMIGRSIAEPIENQGVPAAERASRVADILQRVSLSPEMASRYPHELSGGQLQRVAIARALIGDPEFIVADEPLASLDLSVQAQVMALLRELQQQLGVALLFITHDLTAAQYLSNRIAVMYLGKNVEIAPARNFAKAAVHPYSRALLNSVLRLDPEVEQSRESAALEGEVPSPLHPPKGCRFNTRCPLAKDICRQEQPAFKQVADDHHVACWVV